VSIASGAAGAPGRRRWRIPIASAGLAIAGLAIAAALLLRPEHRPPIVATPDAGAAPDAGSPRAVPEADVPPPEPRRDAGIDAGPARDGALAEEDKPRGFGFLEANASPWAAVKIDGKPRGETPLKGLKLPAGRHSAVFTNPELSTEERRSFVVRPGQTTRLIVDMEP
jgi:hypothetical protein